MNGGPGVSSVEGMLAENGPFQVQEERARLDARPHAWTSAFTMLYVDHPVGSGLSSTDKDEGYARNMEDVTRDFVEFLRQFFQVFEALREAPFYLVGESYGGKFVTAIAAFLAAQGARAPCRVAGIMLGNADIDRVYQYNMAGILQSTGKSVTCPQM